MSGQTISHESDRGRWEMVQRAPHPSLRAHVREYGGWSEDFAAPLCRREVPTEVVPVVINFAAPVRMFDVQDPSRWSRLVQTGGRVSIGTLVDEVGFSQRHLIGQFREQIGLSPKTLARVLRFGRAIRMIKDGGRPNLAAVAQDCGYYDQAHFSRDFHTFAGVTPTELVRSQLPDGGGFIVDR